MENQSSNKSLVFQTMEDQKGKKYEFFRVDHLPTGGLHYNYTNEDKVVYVRGLRAGEAKALSRLISSENGTTIDELLSVYENVIIGVNPRDLAEIDFIILLTFSNIYTQSKAGWNIEEKCPYEECGGNVNTIVTLFDIEISDPLYEKLPIEFKTSTGDLLEFSLPSLAVISEYEKLRDSNKNLDKEFLSFAPLITTINGEDKSLTEKYEYLMDMEPNDFLEIPEIDRQLVMKIKPLKLTCPHCKKEFDFEFSLTYQKAYPLPRL